MSQIIYTPNWDRFADEYYQDDVLTRVEHQVDKADLLKELAVKALCKAEVADMKLTTRRIKVVLGFLQGAIIAISLIGFIDSAGGGGIFGNSYTNFMIGWNCLFSGTLAVVILALIIFRMRERRYIDLFNLKWRQNPEHFKKYIMNSQKLKEYIDIANKRNSIQLQRVQRQLGRISQNNQAIVYVLPPS